MDAPTTDQQLLLGGGTEPAAGAATEEFPPDIAQAMAIVSGTAFPGEDGTMEGLDPGKKGETNAQQRWTQTMLKKHEQANIITVLSEPNIRVLDIASEDGQKEAQKIYELIGNPGNGYVGRESAPKMILDHKAERGFRCLVTFKWWKPVKDVKPFNGSYEPTGPKTPESAPA